MFHGSLLIQTSMLKHDIPLSLLLFDSKTGNNAGTSLLPIQVATMKIIIFHFMADRTLGSLLWALSSLSRAPWNPPTPSIVGSRNNTHCMHLAVSVELYWCWVLQRYFNVKGLTWQRANTWVLAGQWDLWWAKWLWVRFCNKYLGWFSAAFIFVPPVLFVHSFVTDTV